MANACERIREILLENPYASRDGLEALLREEGFKISALTVSSQRRSFLEVCRFLKREGQFDLWKGKRKPKTTSSPKSKMHAQERESFTASKRRPTKSEGRPFRIWWNQSDPSDRD